jgi:hypothetical protein
MPIYVDFARSLGLRVKPTSRRCFDTDTFGTLLPIGELTLGSTIGVSLREQRKRHSGRSIVEFEVKL